ncbi:MAG: hypoxanthine phosphoribosyltransferase [Planctomycetota bacterium]|nr:MAG: hypoxanthine phosphoribosyltransferase [Planctomycetota bacterium]
MRTIISQEQLQEGVQRLANEIREYYQGKSLTMIGVLADSLIFLGDLVRSVGLPHRLGIVPAHRSASQDLLPGPLVVVPEQLRFEVEHRDVLLVDELLDSGDTLNELIPQIDDLGPKSVRVAVLLRKQGRQKPGTIEPAFVGFDIPEGYAVGYGMSYNDRFRELPYIAQLDPEDFIQDAGT